MYTETKDEKKIDNKSKRKYPEPTERKYSEPTERKYPSSSILKLKPKVFQCDECKMLFKNNDQYTQHQMYKDAALCATIKLEWCYLCQKQHNVSTTQTYNIIYESNCFFTQNCNMKHFT